MPMTPSTAFDQAVARVRTLQVRPELDLVEAPAPRRMAPDALALTIDANDGDVDLGSGRFVILHNPAGEAAWEGTMRLVLYVDAVVESDLAGDPLLPEVGWSWLQESLADAGMPYWALGGTVTRVQSESYGAMAERGLEGRLQVRASWTGAQVSDLPAHVTAWTSLMATACGLEPVPEGVAVLRPRG